MQKQIKQEITNFLKTSLKLKLFFNPSNVVKMLKSTLYRCKATSSIRLVIFFPQKYHKPKSNTENPINTIHSMWAASLNLPFESTLPAPRHLRTCAYIYSDTQVFLVLLSLAKTNLVQACTEMIMPTSGDTEESIFPAYEWEYKYRAASCKRNFGIEPRPLWITTEFGGHVSIHIFYHFQTIFYSFFFFFI